MALPNGSSHPRPLKRLHHNWVFLGKLQRFLVLARQLHYKGLMEKTTNNGSPADADELKKRSKELATDAGHSLASKANDTGKKGMSALGRKIDEAANAVSEAGMRQAVDPESPLAPHHVSKVTGPMREAAHYLDTRDPRGLLTDIDGAVHRHPYRAIAIGVATGWVVGKLFRSR